MPTQIDSLAQVYARSLYELAETAGGQDKIVEIGDELEQICEVARKDQSFREFLRSPIVDRKARSAAISSIFSNNVTDLTLRFLLVLNGKGRLGHLESIAAAFDQLLQESFGRVEVDVFTPTELDEVQIESIRGRVKEAIGKEPVIYPYTDPAMLGGIRLRIGDQLIDASVSSQLRRMKDQLLEGGHDSLRQRLGQILDDATPETSG